MTGVLTLNWMINSVLALTVGSLADTNELSGLIVDGISAFKSPKP